jgi:hypothetical protein
VTGRLVFPANQFGDYIEQILNPEVRPLRSIDREIPLDLEETCLRSLSRPVSARFPSCHDFAEALRNCGTPSTTSDDRRESQAPVAGRSMLGVYSAATVVVSVAAAVTIMFGLTGFFRNDPPPGPAEEGGPADTKLLGGISVVEPGDWHALLATDQELVAWWPRLTGTQPTHEKQNDGTFTVVAHRNPWLVKSAVVRHLHPFEIKATLAIPEWIGEAGVVWGLRRDEDNPQQYRCWWAGYLCSGEKSKPKVVVQERLLNELQPGKLWVDTHITIDQKLISRPVSLPDPVLRVSVWSDELEISFGDSESWKPVDPIGRVSTWLPDGESAFGLAGSGDSVQIRSVWVRVSNE